MTTLTEMKINSDRTTYTYLLFFQYLKISEMPFYSFNFMLYELDGLLR